MADLSSILPTMPTYFGAQLPVSPPSSGSSPLMDALRTVTAVKPAVAQNPYSLVPAASGPPANPQSHFGAVLPTMSSPAARVAAPAAPVSSGGASPPAAGSEWSAPTPGSMSPETAATNFIPGGMPGADHAGLAAQFALHPIDYTAFHAAKLANAMQASAPPTVAAPGAPQDVTGQGGETDYTRWMASKRAEQAQNTLPMYNGQSGAGFTELGPNSPRMEAPAHPAAVNVIRAGIPDNGGSGGGGISPAQLAAIAPFLEKRQEFNLNADAQNNIDLRSMATATRDRALKAAGTDPLKRQLALSEYERQLWALKGGANMGFLRANYKTDPVTGELVAP
jgi:hypothetical protein